MLPRRRGAIPGRRATVQNAATDLDNMRATATRPVEVSVERGIGGLEHFSDGRSSLQVPQVLTWHDRPMRPTFGFRSIAGTCGWPSLPGLSPAGRCPMTTAAPSTALATIQPAFTDAERLALAGFLAGYRGLTREAYALDLRQFTAWCRAGSLACCRPPRRYRGLRPRPGGQGTGPGDCHPAAVHHRRVLQVRGRRGTHRSLTRRARPPSAGGLRVPRGREALHGHSAVTRRRRTGGRRGRPPTW